MTKCISKLLVAKSLLLCAILLLDISTATAQNNNIALHQEVTLDNEAEGNKTVSKVFKVCPFNVDGLPQKFGWISVNPDGKGAEGAKAIGQYIAQSDVDFWGLSEDFNYHNDLANELDTVVNFQIGKYRGGINLHNFKLNARFDTDGLNFICKKPYSFSNQSWTKWNKSYGWADHGNDEMITKGYRYYLANLGDGIFVDFYIMHMDADTGEKDNAARASQMEQLRNAILANNSNRPVIVMGDTNCRYTRDNLLGLFINPIEEAGNYEVKDAWVELCKEGTYPTLGADPLMVGELGYLQGEVVDKVIYLNPKKGDTHLSALHFNVDTEMSESDHKPVIATMEVKKETATTGIGCIKPATSDSQRSTPIIYHIDGSRRSELTKGINIVKMSDGRVKKIFK